MLPVLHSFIFAASLFLQTSLAIRWDCATCGGGPGDAPRANQLSGCVSNCLQNAPVNYYNCIDVDCICPASHLPQAVAAITACASASCMNDPGGVALATDIALSYCQTWSQTAPPAVVGPTAMPTTTPPAASNSPITHSAAAVTAATTNQPTPTPNTPNPPPGSPSSLFQLYNCAPCGKRTCSFTPGGALDTAVYSLRVGTPISNCDKGSTANITNTVTGSLMLSDTWSVTTNVGLDFGELKIGGSATWGQTKSTTVSHSISIQIAPGQLGVMVANVQYKRTSGSMQIDPVQAAVSLISNQPVTVISYDQEIVQCGSPFSANDTQPSQCGSGSKSTYANGFLTLFSVMVTSSLLFILYL